MSCLLDAQGSLTALFYLSNQMSFIPRFLQSHTPSTPLNLLESAKNGSDSLLMLEQHKQLLPYLLTFVLDIAIFFALYQYRRYAIILHALIAVLCFLTALITALPLLIHLQIPTEGPMQTHAIIGVVVLILILVQLTAGLISKALQCISHSTSYGIFLLNRVHRVNGYILALLGKVEVYLALWNGEEREKMWALLAVDGGLMVLLLVRKVTRKEVQSLATAVGQGEEEVPLMETIDQLGKDHHVGVFANYIYDISPLQRFHPMGFEIIQAARGRDFDRFLFGSAPTEQLSSIPPHAHSIHSLKLLGPPLAKLHIPSLYGNLEKEMTPVRIKELVRISEHGQLYEVRLVGLSGEGFPCRGYSSVLQLGRYFVLNLDGCVSRLYITVSFLAPRNIQLLEQIYFRPNKTSIYSIAMLPFNYAPADDFPVTERALRARQQDDYLPLFIKKYPGGMLSSKLIGQEFKDLRISEQRGQGLRVDRVTPGKVVIFLGGTGIIPFGDLIDLLFKAVLMQSHPQYRSLILAQNPLLESDCLKGFSFRFFLEEHYCEDIHPLTRMQLTELTKHPSLVEFTLKCHEKVEDGRLKRSGVRLVSEGLEEMVRTELEKGADGVVQYWVCCSPVMSAKIKKIFEEKKIPQNKYAFL